MALAERGEVGQGEERSRGEIVRDAQDGRKGAGEPGAAGRGGNEGLRGSQEGWREGQGLEGNLDSGLERVSEKEECTPARAQRRKSAPRTAFRAPGPHPRCRRARCAAREREETSSAAPAPRGGGPRPPHPHPRGPARGGGDLTR